MIKNINRTARKIAVGVLIASLAVSSYGCGAKNGTGESKTSTEATEASTESSEQAKETTSGNRESTESTEDNKASTTEITLINHPLTSQIDGKDMASGFYPEIILPDGMAEKYPKLDEAVKEQNDNWKKDAEDSVAEYAVWASEYSFGGIPFSYEVSAEIKRADDKLFSVLVSFMQNSGGAHPNHGNYTINFDPVTGENLPISKILEKSDDLPKIIRTKMEEQTPGIMEEVDSFHYGDGEVFADKLAENSYSWTLTDKGLHIYFSPYEIASYAAGYFDVIIGNDEKDGLIKDEYKISEKQDLEHLVKNVDGESVKVEPKYDDGDDGSDMGNESSAVTIVNPGWKKYCRDVDAKKDIVPVKLIQTSRKSSDWLDASVWADENGFEVARFPYSDGTYTYHGLANYSVYDYMYSELQIYDADDKELLYDYDLNVLCNGPDEAEGTRSGAGQYIYWAQIVDNILYVSVGHGGYSSEEKNSNYMVAIDLSDNSVLWRSDPLVSNASNFKIVGDTIICGYGFTAEPDYIYLLNRYTGDKVSSIDVASAPYQFEIVDKRLYVATYDTAYEFMIK